MPGESLSAHSSSRSLCKFERNEAIQMIVTETLEVRSFNAWAYFSCMQIQKRTLEPWPLMMGIEYSRKYLEVLGISGA